MRELQSPLTGWESPETPAWPSLADVALIIASVMIVYVMAQFVIGAETVMVALEISTRQSALRAEIEGAVRDSTLRASLLFPPPDANLQRIAFSDRVLFDVGRDELRPSGEAILGVVGRVLSSNTDAFDRIQVEGHTDTTPMRPGSEFESNWELSSARATAVVRYLESVANIRPELLSATGYSQYQPAAQGTDPESLARNRRVELVVVYSAAQVLEQALEADTLTGAASGG